MLCKPNLILDMQTIKRSETGYIMFQYKVKLIASQTLILE